jgi:hypothetical protein
VSAAILASRLSPAGGRAVPKGVRDGSGTLPAERSGRSSSESLSSWVDLRRGISDADVGDMTWKLMACPLMLSVSIGTITSHPRM